MPQARFGGELRDMMGDLRSGNRKEFRQDLGELTGRFKSRNQGRAGLPEVRRGRGFRGNWFRQNSRSTRRGGRS